MPCRLEYTKEEEIEQCQKAPAEESEESIRYVSDTVQRHWTQSASLATSCWIGARSLEESERQSDGSKGQFITISEYLAFNFDTIDSAPIG